MDNETDLSQVIDGAGPITGLFVLLLAIAIVFLVVNMNKQFKKVDKNLPEGPDEKLHDYDMNLQEQAVERGEDDAPQR